MRQNPKNKRCSIFASIVSQSLHGIDLGLLRNTLKFFWFMETHDPSWYVPWISGTQNIGQYSGKISVTYIRVYMVDPTNTCSKCPNCGEGDHDVEHWLCNCPAILDAQRKLFGEQRAGTTNKVPHSVHRPGKETAPLGRAAIGTPINHKPVTSTTRMVIHFTWFHAMSLFSHILEMYRIYSNLSCPHL